MERAIVTESKLTAIADAIRTKTGESGELTLDEMATAVSGISTDVIQYKKADFDSMGVVINGNT